jgi:hypothetical protein
MAATKGMKAEQRELSGMSILTPECLRTSATNESETARAVRYFNTYTGVLAHNRFEEWFARVIARQQQTKQTKFAQVEPTLRAGQSQRIASRHD